VTPTRWLITILSFAAAVGASIYIAYTTWPDQRNPAILPLWGHAAAFALVALEIGARALKIHLSAASLRVPLSFGASIRTCLGGDFGAAITPGRTGAEPARFLILAEAGVLPADNFLLLWIELFLEMLSLAGVAAAGVILSRRNVGGPPPAWADTLGLHAGRWRAIQRMLRRVRASVERLRDAQVGPLVLAYLASVLHVLVRLSVLPALIFALGGSAGLATRAQVAPLILWPLALVYGAVVAPVPGGGGFVEVTFRHFLGRAIPASLLGASLVWWRFYTFYLYVILGALSAGRSVMRALRTVEEDVGEEEEAPAPEPAVREA
jgi:uncharacterized membrane protein YbhN (UPF0104 family)